MKKVTIIGASGKVGQEVLKLCLLDSSITEIVNIVQTSTGTEHFKLTEIQHSNFLDFTSLESSLKYASAAFCCIENHIDLESGADLEKHLKDVPIAFAKTIEMFAPGTNFCFLSIQGADTNLEEKHSIPYYKGKAEEEISKLNLKFFSFRPHLAHSISEEKNFNFIEEIKNKIHSMKKIFSEDHAISPEQVAGAMYRAAFAKFNHQQIYENQEILKL